MLPREEETSIGLRQSVKMDIRATTSATVDWMRWAESVRQYLQIAMKDTTEAEKCAIMLYHMAEKDRVTFKSVPFEEEEVVRIENTLLKNFTQYWSFEPKVNTTMERFKFNNRCQNAEESLDQYITHLKYQAAKCGYGPSKDEMIRDRFVCGVSDGNLKERLIQDPDLTLDKVISIIYHPSEQMQTANLNIKVEPGDDTVENQGMLSRNRQDSTPSNENVSVSTQALVTKTEDDTGEQDASIQNPNAALLNYSALSESSKSRTIPSSNGLHRCDTCGETFRRLAALTHHEKTHFMVDGEKWEGQPPLAVPEIPHDQERDYHPGEEVDIDQMIVSDSDSETDEQTKPAVDQNPDKDDNKGKEPRTFECEECHKTYTNKYLLKRHLNVHLPVKPYGCDQCDSRFIWKKSLKVHKQIIHEGLKPYQCEICGFACATSTNLKIHSVTHTTEKPHQCEECGKCYKLKSLLVQHKKVHTGEKPHQCEVCGKTFLKLANLKVHKSVHTEIRPFPCQYCEKSFKSKNELKIHGSIHSETRDFACDICGKQFTRASTLCTHKKTMHCEIRLKPHSCEICGRSFPRKKAVINHMTTHSDEKPFQCDVCEQWFKTNATLRHHKILHEGVKHECQNCGKAFARRSYLTEHYKRGVCTSEGQGGVAVGNVDDFLV